MKMVLFERLCEFIEIKWRGINYDPGHSEKLELSFVGWVFHILIILKFPDVELVKKQRPVLKVAPGVASVRHSVNVRHSVKLSH